MSSTQHARSPDLKNVSAELSEDGWIALPGIRLLIRPAEERHRSFILATWVRSIASTVRKTRVISGPANLGLSNQIFLTEEPKLAERFWAHSWVVTPEDDENVIHAWACGKPGTLYHAYTPPDLRRVGVCRSLVTYICGEGMVQYGKVLPFAHQPKRWVYNPYIYGNE